MIPMMMDKKKKGLVAIILEGKDGKRKEEMREEGDEPSADELLMDYSKAMMKAIEEKDVAKFHEALKEWVDCYETHPHEEYEEEEEGEEEEG
ncbi:hypothetical protein EBT31_15115 [bacterium]|jgi:basic membrane lipoprotein Med (substrate-binding protein (PBP1-ABC) superfamily)|nr:hypothetical protein [bacterium]